MSQAEVPGNQVGEPPPAAMSREVPGMKDGAPELDFYPAARQRADEISVDFQERLTSTARICAEKDKCDCVQQKHVDQAEELVCRMAANGGAFRLNPQVWWLLAGVCFASALAIPDAGAMFFGNADDGWVWLALKSLFLTLSVCGFFAAVVAFMIALGPQQPKWFTASYEAISRLARRR